MTNAFNSKYSVFIKLGLDHGTIVRLGQYMKRAIIIKTLSQLKRKNNTALFLDIEKSDLCM